MAASDKPANYLDRQRSAEDSLRAQIAKAKAVGLASVGADMVRQADASRAKAEATPDPFGSWDAANDERPSVCTPEAWKETRRINVDSEDGRRALLATAQRLFHELPERDPRHSLNTLASYEKKARCLRGLVWEHTVSGKNDFYGKLAAIRSEGKHLISGMMASHKPEGDKLRDLQQLVVGLQRFGAEYGWKNQESPRDAREQRNPAGFGIWRQKKREALAGIASSAKLSQQYGMSAATREAINSGGERYLISITQPKAKGEGDKPRKQKRPRDWREKAVAAVVDPDKRLGMAILAETGARPEELRRGVTIKLDEAKGEITFAVRCAKAKGTAGKSIHTRYLTRRVNGEISKLIAAQCAASGGRLEYSADDFFGNEASIRKALYRSLDKVDDKRLAGVSPYSFRHQIASDLKAQGETKTNIAAWMGHHGVLMQAQYGSKGRGSRAPQSDFVRCSSEKDPSTKVAWHGKVLEAARPPASSTLEKLAEVARERGGSSPTPAPG